MGDSGITTLIGLGGFIIGVIITYAVIKNAMLDALIEFENRKEKSLKEASIDPEIKRQRALQNSKDRKKSTVLYTVILAVIVFLALLLF
ncbi:MAG: hypothetical protein ACON5K_04070 [Bacteroidia bacterium]